MALLKKAFLFLLFVSPVLAEDLVVGPFKGLNNQDPSVLIPNENAQDLQNVNITPNGNSVKKREGYGLASTLSITTSAVHGGFKFQDTVGHDIQLWGHDSKLSVSVDRGIPTVLVGSATYGATWDCTDTQGTAYCANTSRDALYSTEGLTVGWNGWGKAGNKTVPLGTMVEITPERLLVSGTTHYNRIYQSVANSFLDFTLGADNEDAWWDDIASPGSRITNLKTCQGKIFWFKDQSFGFLDGDNQTNTAIETVSDTVGTLDNTAVCYDNVLYFRGQDNHFYSFDGNNFTIMSREITPTILTANRRKQNTWLQTSDDDFHQGVLTSSGMLTSVNGTVQPSSFSRTDDTTAEFNNGYFTNTTSTQGAVNYVKLLLSGGVFKTSGQYLSQTFDTGLSSAIGGIQSVSFTEHVSGATQVQFVLQTSTHQAEFGGVRVSLSSSSLSNKLDRYVRYIASMTTTDTSVTPYFSAVTLVARSSGVYYSAVHHAPDLSQWDILAIGYITSEGGSVNFWTRASTSSFNVQSSSPLWESANPNEVVKGSTGTYFQMKAYLDIAASTDVPRFSNFTFNWFEGSAADKAYATYFDNGLWWSVSLGTSTTTNNRVLRYDLLNKTWLVDAIPSNGFLVDNLNLYFGSPTGGYTYKFGGVNADNGAAIHSFWKSKDFPGSNPFVEAEYKRIDLLGKNANDTDLTITYQLDTSTSTSYTVNLASTTRSIVRHSKLLPAGKTGNFFNVMFGDNSIFAPWEILGLKVLFTPLPWRPTQ